MLAEEGDDEGRTSYDAVLTIEGHDGTVLRYQFRTRLDCLSRVTRAKLRSRTRKFPVGSEVSSFFVCLGFWLWVGCLLSVCVCVCVCVCVFGFWSVYSNSSFLSFFLSFLFFFFFFFLLFFLVLFFSFLSFGENLPNFIQAYQRTHRRVLNSFVSMIYQARADYNRTVPWSHENRLSRDGRRALTEEENLFTERDELFQEVGRALDVQVRPGCRSWIAT